MSKITKITCDRCGRELLSASKFSSPSTLKDTTAKITLWGVGESKTSNGQRIDLCEDCYNDF